MAADAVAARDVQQSGRRRRHGTFGGEVSSDDGWSPSSIFLEQPLKREIAPFYLK